MEKWIENEIGAFERGGFSARVVERTDVRFDWVKTHVVEVSGNVGSGHCSYVVGNLSYPGEAQDLARELPAPTQDLDGAEFSAWRDGGAQAAGWYLLSEKSSGIGEADSLYALADFAVGVAVEDVFRPKLRAVAIDQTHCMADGVVDVIGRVKGVYSYDASTVTHLGEITPSYELDFQQNVCERAFSDAEEGDIDAVFAEAGYEDELRFTSDDGGERVTYMHCRDVDRLHSEPLATNPSFDIECMLERDDDARRRMIEEAISEFGANGGFDANWFKDARPVAEIVADGQRRRAERESEADAAPTPGM